MKILEMLRIRSIRGKIIVSFVAIFTIVFALYSYAIFQSSYNIVYQELQASSEDNLRYVQGNINRLLDQFVALSDNIYYDRDIAKVLLRKYQTDPTANLEKDLQTAIKNIASYEGSNIISQYTTCLIVHGDNGQTIRYGFDADYFTTEEVENFEEFEEYSRENQVVILPCVDSPSSHTFAGKYLKILRAAISLDSYRRIGWQYLGISTDLIEDTIHDYGFDPETILLVFDSRNQLIYTNHEELTQETAAELLGREQASGDLVDFQDNQWMMVQNRSDYSGLSMIQLIDRRSLQSEISLFLRSMVIASVLALITALVMMAILTNWLTRPIQKSIRALGRISGGDFSIDRSLEGDDEVGKMGKAINSLAIDIDALMMQAREEERQKKQLEYKMLQNQINPHFVYNVLNSIKVMANLQGAENISRLVDNFGGLLKEVSKGVNDKVTIPEEFELTKKYIYMMNLRKKGLIHTTFHIEEGLERCVILKFLLQPLVENAIVHGFEGKMGIKELKIEARKVDENLEVTILDNGNGMTQEEIRRTFEKGDSGKRKSGYNPIGIGNIRERIQLLYGRDYGIFYDSVKTEYTRARVLLPLEVQEGVDEQNV